MKNIPTEQQLNDAIDATIKLLPDDFSFASLIQFAVLAAAGYALFSFFAQ